MYNITIELESNEIPSYSLFSYLKANHVFYICILPKTLQMLSGQYHCKPLGDNGLNTFAANNSP